MVHFFAGERRFPHFNVLARGDPHADVAISDISLKLHSLAYISAAESIGVSSLADPRGANPAMPPHHGFRGLPPSQAA